MRRWCREREMGAAAVWRAKHSVRDRRLERETRRLGRVRGGWRPRPRDPSQLQHLQQVSNAGMEPLPFDGQAAAWRSAWYEHAARAARVAYQRGGYTEAEHAEALSAQRHAAWREGWQDAREDMEELQLRTRMDRFWGGYGRNMAWPKASLNPL